MVSIVSSTVDSVTLEFEVTGLAASDMVSIREHVTLADFGNFVNVQDGDLVSVYNTDGTTITAQYYTAFNGWYDGAFALQDDLIIFPGEGVVMNSTVSREAVFYGSVIDNAILSPYAGSNIINIIGTLEPVSGQTLVETFPSPADGTLVSIYSEGSLTPLFTAQYYTTFAGWYDGSFTLRDSAVIDSGSAAVMKTSADSDALHEAAY
ncbi:MAG: hypothetical protein AB3N64_03945 [Puniceicoccaceae bacterium]